MVGYFEPLPGGGATVRLGETEISVLRSFTTQLLDLLGPGAKPGADNAETLLASVFDTQPTTAPADPVLARLFPDAYADPEHAPDEETRAASAEFRRYTETDLRARKRADALALVRGLDTLDSPAPEGAELRLTPPDCRHWLGTLNDLRLALGTRLNISADEDSEAFVRLPDADPRKPSAMLYLWLSGMQETLIDALMPSTDG